MLRRKKNGRYYADCVVGGRRVRRSMHTVELTVALDRYSAFLKTQIPADNLEASRRGALARLARWHVETYLAGAGEKTVQAARSAWRGFLEWCRTQDLTAPEELSPNTVLAWYVSMLGRGLSQGGAAYRVNYIRAGIRAAVDTGLIDRDPVGSWPRWTHRQKPLESFAAGQLQQVLDIVRRYAPEVYPVVLFLSATAWRLSDALWLHHGGGESRGPKAPGVTAAARRRDVEAGVRAPASPCPMAATLVRFRFSRKPKVPPLVLACGRSLRAA